MSTPITKLSPQLLEKIKIQLEGEKERLDREVKTILPAGEGFPEYGSDEDDNVHEVEEFTSSKPLAMTLEKTLRDVNKALARIEAGTYGTCKYCDQPIDEKRLLARPTSSACVSCKKTLTDEI